MDKDVADVLGTAAGRLAREAAQGLSKSARKRARGGLSPPAGLAAGAGLALLTPLAARGAGKLVRNAVSNGAGSLKEMGAQSLKDVGGKAIKDVGGKALKDVGGKSVKEAGGKLGEAIPGVGGGKSEGVPGVGSGRRMPVQQDIDIGAPIQKVYNQWTQFEEWPNFMHRLTQVSQEDPGHLTFKTKIWGVSKEFKAEIVEQRPEELIKWRVTEGVTHNGIVTFHELGPRLTRVEVNLDVEPGSLLEKAARGMRHVKRAVRADLARFKAYVLMEDEETGAWRGEIEEGDVKKKRSSSQSQRRSSSSRSRSGSRSRSTSSNGGSRSKSNGSSRSGSKSGSRSASNSGSRSRSGGSARSGRGRSGAHS
jgi:uncharacterized membrane protein